MLLFLIIFTLTTQLLISSPEQLQSLTISLAPLAEVYKTLPEETGDLAAQLQKKLELKKKKDLEAAHQAEEQKKQEEETQKKEQEAEDKLRKMPLEELYRQIKLYPGAAARLKFLDPVVSAEHIKIAQSAKDKTKKEITESLAAIEQQLANLVKTPIEQAIDKYSDQFQKFSSKIKNGDTIAAASQIGELQKILDQPNQDGKTFRDALNAVINKLKASQKKISELSTKEILARGQTTTIIQDIVNAIEKEFQKPADALNYYQLKQQNRTGATAAKTKLVSDLILSKLGELLQNYALSNNPTSKNYSAKNDQTNFALLQEFIEAAAQIPEIASIITKLKSSSFISKLKDIRDTDIKKLEELYAYYNLEQNKLKNQPGPRILLERIINQIEQVKSSIDQQLKAITGIPEIKKVVDLIKTQLLKNYAPIKSAQKQEIEEKAEMRKAQDILNFFILYYLNPQGTVRAEFIQPNPFLPSVKESTMNATSKEDALRKYDQNLTIFSKTGRPALTAQYNLWRTKLHEMATPQKGTDNKHETDLEVFEEEELKNVKDVNRLIIENYDIKNNKFIRNIKMELDALKQPAGDYEQMFGYKAWYSKM